MRRGIHRFRLLSATALILIDGQAGAQTTPADPGLLSLDRIFASRDFAAERFGPARWMADGDSYTTVEPAGGGGPGRDLVLYRAESGRREILVAAATLVPPGASEPLAIEDYAWSPDGKVLIVMTNSRRVWRQNTRGDFWTYDLASGRLRPRGPQLARPGSRPGAPAPESPRSTSSSPHRLPRLAGSSLAA